ncbi:cellular communication network factor 1, like 2 [Gouania willdenowi]|uniref:Protein CYR61-like n=1 Tax=Gouania willdenowi TaxID=441366 RepID=A0A8C5HH78_GOUWI|nr:protein CYR61-like [Gouania willdenowi]
MRMFEAQQHGLCVLCVLSVLLHAAAAMAESECPAECSCAPTPPLCLPGVSWVSDGCGCCKVCARQFNEDCSTNEPCDHIKGLRCHLGVGGDPDRGLCRAEAYGLPCAFNGRVYQHGEDFQPICQHQCTCMNGVVGCTPLCPPQLPLPLWLCSWPRLSRADGGCCEQWVCDDNNRIAEGPDEPRATPTVDQLHPNHIDSLLRAPTPPQQPGENAYKERLSFPVSKAALETSCIPQSSGWTLCSTTCGMGVSSQVTNHNPECQLTRETRLCQIRDCEQRPAIITKGKRCQRTVRPEEPMSITFGACSTSPRYRPRFCGGCSDRRCCTPSSSRTARLRFHCPDGDTFYNVMWIQRCSCRASCRLDDGAFSPAIDLSNDVHTFMD